MSKSGKVVVITGGSRGIGRSIAQKFAEDKARIVIIHYDKDQSASDETLTMLEEKATGSTFRILRMSSRFFPIFSNGLEKWMS